MSSAVREIFSHLLGRLIEPEMFVAGFVLAFGLWCVDYAFIEHRRRPAYAAVLVLVAATIIYAVVYAVGDASTLWRVSLLSILTYLPLHFQARRSAR